SIYCARVAPPLEPPRQRIKLQDRLQRRLPLSGEEIVMTSKAVTTAATVLVVSLSFCGAALAQDLGPNVRKLADGVYAFVGENFTSTAGTGPPQEGVFLIDSGHNPVESRKLMDVVKKLTPMPVRLLIDSEPHPDHTTGHFVFSPPAVIVAAAGAGDSMRAREREAPQRIQQTAATSPAVKTTLERYRF